MEQESVFSRRSFLVGILGAIVLDSSTLDEKKLTVQDIGEEQVKLSRKFPRNILAGSERMLAAYARAEPVSFTKSATSFELEAIVGTSYRVFVTRTPQGHCIQVQSTLTKNGFGEYQDATIFMTENEGKNERIVSASLYASRPYAAVKEWDGRGYSRFEMRLPKDEKGLVIDHYTVPGYGFNELYPQFSFPPAYASLVKAVLADAGKNIKK